MVHAVRIGEDLVFLEAGADAYFCLPGGAKDITLSPGGRALAATDPELAADLAAAGLLQPLGSDPITASRGPTALPCASAITEATPPPSWRDGLEAFRAILDLALHYRGRSFAEILAALGPPAPSTSDLAPGPELLALVHRFHRWAPYAPVSAKCLLRSFMLLRLLRRHGHDARWVFGVTTWPFEAHCWLQCGDVVLDDHFERLWRYQPILAV
jgi:hypothetical protein